MKVLLINSDDGLDYLADLVNYFFITNNFEIYTNHNFEYLFQSFGSKENLYGKGFTIYGTIDSSNKDSITVYDIESVFENIQIYDLVVFTSIHRNYKNKKIKDFFNILKSKNQTDNVIVLDGEDFTDIDEEVAKVTNYFKRELIERYDKLAKPISLSFPKLQLQSETFSIEKKTQLLAPMDPRFSNSYIFDEKSYYQQYSKSIFATTVKKAGWDCMRHYEILSSLTLLYFPNIENKPKLTMNYFPLKLQIEVNNLFIKLLTNHENVDTVENIRSSNYSKNIFRSGIKKVKTKMSKMNIIENNFKTIEFYNSEFNSWFMEYGTTDSYQERFSL